MLVAGFTQTVPHTMGAVSGHMHFPAMHAWVVAQGMPHPPQWVVLVWVSTQAPPHRVAPAGQAQAPAMQV